MHATPPPPPSHSPFPSQQTCPFLSALCELLLSLAINPLSDRRPLGTGMYVLGMYAVIRGYAAAPF